MYSLYLTKSVLILSICLIPFQSTHAIFIQQTHQITNPSGVPEPDVKINLPIQLLMNDNQECPRLQEMGAKLLNDPEFCDIDLEVLDPRTNESRTFCAHKSILCMRSPVLKEKIRELVASGVGPEKPKLRLPNMEPDVFKNILRYIYVDKIDSYFDLKRNIMDLYVIADYLGMPDLMKMIEEYLYQKVSINDISFYLTWAKQHKLDKMKRIILDFSRNALGMSTSDWKAFIQNICVNAGYSLSAESISKTGYIFRTPNGPVVYSSPRKVLLSETTVLNNTINTENSK